MQHHDEPHSRHYLVCTVADLSGQHNQVTFHLHIESQLVQRIPFIPPEIEIGLLFLDAAHRVAGSPRAGGGTIDHAIVEHQVRYIGAGAIFRRRGPAEP
jgi:hypothetical protein